MFGLFEPSMGIFDRTKFQGPFGVDQLYLWMFWTGPNVPHGYPGVTTVLSPSLESG